MKKRGLYDRSKDAVTRIIQKDHRKLHWWIRWPHYLLKLLSFSLYKFWRDNGFARSATLAYSTILALVPTIAILLLVLGAMQEHAAGTKSFVFKLFIPTSESGIEKPLDDLATSLSDSVRKLFEGSPGTISILTVLGLVLTIVFLLNTIEESMNDIWRTIKSRSWITKFRNSWLMMTVGPVLLFLSYFLTVWLGERQGTAATAETPFMLDIFLRLLPYLLSIVFFFFLFALVPFTRVRLFTALIAAVVAGALWNISKEGFNSYVKYSVYYHHVFGRMAILPLFLIWIYVSWIITLFAAEMGFCHQNFDILDTQGQDAFSTVAMSREYVAVRAVLEICRAHESGQDALTLHRLSGKIKVSELLLLEVIEPLMKANILHTVGETESGYFPSRPASRIQLSDVIEPVRSDALLVPPNTGLKEDVMLADLFKRARAATIKPLRETKFSDLLGLDDAESEAASPFKQDEKPSEAESASKKSERKSKPSSADQKKDSKPAADKK
ncbi:MAG: YhjD/YihY/BrkB family envelope integrity protein [Planctomycetota bacterium]|jgi:membrane protein